MIDIFFDKIIYSKMYLLITLIFGVCPLCFENPVANFYPICLVQYVSLAQGFLFNKNRDAAFEQGKINEI